MCAVNVTDEYGSTLAEEFGVTNNTDPIMFFV
jgi:hypothetical protein